MTTKLIQAVEQWVRSNHGTTLQQVQKAATGVGGVPLPKAEADANLRKNFTQRFKDKKLADQYCDDVGKALQKRNKPNPTVSELQQECQYQLRRHMWIELVGRQDEMIERLTAGQVNKMGGDQFPKHSAGRSEPIGWAISNKGSGDVLVDKDGCPVKRFKLPMDYNGMYAPNLQYGDVIIANGKVRRRNTPFDPSTYKKTMMPFEGVRQKNAQGNMEGRSVDYMCMDTELNVTVGFGHLISNLEEALSLNFYAVPPGATTDAEARPASKSEITRAYEKLADQGAQAAEDHKKNPTRSDVKQNQSASNFASSSIIEDERDVKIQIRLSRSGGEILFHEDVDRILNDTVRAFPEYSTFPLPAQFGFLDMAYNSGIGTIRNEYKKFKGRGVDKRNWSYAATESDRFKDKKRDDLIRDKFNQAAAEEPFFHDISCGQIRRLDQWHVPGFIEGK